MDGVRIQSLQPGYLEVCAENERLKTELIAERRNGLAAMLDADWITYDDWAEAVRALDALKESE